ncbi:response regulator transcription factor [Gulosibacter molinativorax]|uniref:DNA-binding response regulator n=1 Tax=Gulosibacter molinativorax TaxID=256821 RepID=A0ABT7C5Y1_9MICO|nr:response regulator transcription factor [Gulosibacter molinativorax]MDJ1370594.1 DNA-binding response regulator [Gulosibacter molinativorax]QUY61992.1 Sensory transduction protein regX3 [Gulosibacter molinativorax]
MEYDVLMVDDEEALASSTTEYLAAFGIRADWVASAEAALEFLAAHPTRMLLLDVGLPGMDGFEFCRKVRESKSLPIVFLSARGSDDDEILALTLGGDDYLRKPVSLSVLVAKIRRILERLDNTGPNTDARAGYDDGHLRFDADGQRFFVEDLELELTAMEYRLLDYFVREQDRVLTKDELFEHVWEDAFVGDGTLTVHVRRLRKKIEPDPEHPRYIKTVWGRGYRFEGRGFEGRGLEARA